MSSRSSKRGDANSRKDSKTLERLTVGASELAEILGVSYDRPSRNSAFRERYGLPFRLLSDPDRRVSSLYGARRRGLQRLLPVPRRITYLIDPEGRIAQSYDVVDVAGHASLVLMDIERARSTATDS